MNKQTSFLTVVFQVFIIIVFSSTATSGAAATKTTIINKLKPDISTTNKDSFHTAIIEPPLIYTLPTTCGNGRAEGVEECDDGNRMDGDGCDSACIIEPGVQISADGDRTCALKAEGTLYCWGKNSNGLLGIGTTTDAFRPMPVIGEPDWKYISTGVTHSCAVKRDNKLYCWGNNESGQLGDGTRNNKNTPTRVQSDNNWKYVSSRGGYNTCAITQSDELYCWGGNAFGSVGDGKDEDVLTPKLIESGSKWKNVSVGRDHTCAVKQDNTLYCWGSILSSVRAPDFYISTDIRVPTRVGIDSDWASVSAGFPDFTCAIKQNNRLYCWGVNISGQLGDGTTTSRLFPVLVGSDADWKSVSTGYDFACAIKLDHSLYCWGNNGMGQLGNPAYAYDGSLIPVPVGDRGEWRGTSTAGRWFTCATKHGDKIFCWGSNQFGQLGDSTLWIETSPRYIEIEW